jgi:two-component system OmpR family response regulator
MNSEKGTRKTILAVDNAVMFLNTLKKLLKDAPYDVVAKTSVEEVFEYLDGGNRPDIILLDVEMHDIDGYDLARKIKRGGHSAPIIFITANSEKEYADKAAEVGAACLLVKPLRVNHLLAKLEEFA